MSMLLFDNGFLEGPNAGYAYGELYRLSNAHTFGLTPVGAPAFTMTPYGRGLLSSSANYFISSAYTLGNGNGPSDRAFYIAFSFVVLSNAGRDIFLSGANINSLHFENNSGSFRVYIGLAYITLFPLVVGAHHTVLAYYRITANQFDLYLDGRFHATYSSTTFGEHRNDQLGSGYTNYGNGNTAIINATQQNIGRDMSRLEGETLSSDWLRTIPSHSDYLFYDSALGASTLPTLSLPGVIDIGTTSARPQVTLTY